VGRLRRAGVSIGISAASTIGVRDVVADDIEENEEVDAIDATSSCSEYDVTVVGSTS